MLSEGANATHLNRPKPPAGRRSSATKVDKGSSRRADGDENDENAAPGSILLASPPLAEPGFKMERDLELDLPDALRQALENKTGLWPRRDELTGALHVRQSSFEASHGLAVKAGSLGRRAGLESRRSPTLAPEEESSVIRRRRSPGKEALESLFEPVARENLGDADEETLIPAEDGVGGRASLDSEGNSEYSLDSAFVGELPREELEELLMQANQVIKERERDLGIAAAIGKALLEKNISLRSKHEGIISRLSSINSFSQLVREGDASPRSLPRYSPPTTDVGLDDENTPMPTPRLADYFDGMQHDNTDSEPNLRLQQDMEGRGSIDGEKRRASLPRYSSATGSDIRLREDCFVPSVPPSPAASRYVGGHENSQAQVQLSNETQRQLEMLSEQNEALLEQLAQLQAEAEIAKRDGGKRLKKLTREIDGLRAELESATERNVELEKDAAEEEAHVSGDRDEGRDLRRRWRSRVDNFSEQHSDRANVSLRSSSTIRGGSEADTVERVMASSEDDRPLSTRASDAASLSARSESSASIPGQHRIMGEPERALVAQLMSKIRELEETNASLARAGTEMDGRIGKAMEEGERIRDAYEAVENEAAWEESQLRREDSGLLDTSCAGSPCTSANVSPMVRRRRRAPGNRYIIEGRRTLQTAIRSERDRMQNADGYYSSTPSSLNNSPTKVRGQQRSLRPRILITPSCEDLRAGHEQDSAHGWEDEDRQWRLRADDKAKQQMASTPVTRRSRGREVYKIPQSSLGNFGSLSSNTSLVSLQYGGMRSLGSELGSVYGDEEARDFPRKVLPRNGNNDISLSWADLRRSGSSGSINLRSRASINSLRAASEAESDIADLRWSMHSESTVQPLHDVQEGEMSRSFAPDETARQMIVALPGTDTLPSLDTDGCWLPANEGEVLAQGCLKNEIQSSHDTYEWIEKVTKKMPVQWADDDDFGKPITERDARKLGLLEASSTRSRKEHGLLSWVQGKAMGQPQRKGKGREAPQIESKEALEEKEALVMLLREKRKTALRARVLSGQISLDKARELGALDEDQEDDPRADNHYALDREITARAFAYNAAARSRRPSRGTTRPITEENRNTDGNENSIGDDGLEEGFELVDLDPAKRRPGRRGTDYYPITFKDRYKPAVVKQRAKTFSSEALTWASAWATFSLVMVFAFLVTFSRGPRRVLNGQKK